MKTILLIEDQEAEAELLMRQLATAKTVYRDTVSIVVATTLEGGIFMAESCNPDVIVLDLFLPDSRGEYTVSWIAENAHKMPPIVVLTGSPEPLLQSSAMLKGASDYLHKSHATVMPEILFSACWNSYLRRKRETGKV